MASAFDNYINRVKSRATSAATNPAPITRKCFTCGETKTTRGWHDLGGTGYYACPACQKRGEQSFITRAVYDAQ